MVIANGFRQSDFGILLQHNTAQGGNYRQQVIAGEFTFDSTPDFLVASTHLWGVSTMVLNVASALGTSAGSARWLPISGAFETVYSARSLAGDLNGDGVADLILLDSGIDQPPFPGGHATVLRSNAPSRTHEVVALDLPQAFWHGGSLADIDLDGDLDAVLNATWPGSGDYLLLNDGSGNFTTRQDLLPPDAGRPHGHTWSLLHDLTGDGYPDLVVGTWDAGWSRPLAETRTEFFRNDGGSFAQAMPLVLPRSPVLYETVLDIEPIDLNGDALADLVVSYTRGGDTSEAYYERGYIQFLLNRGDGEFLDVTQSRFPQDAMATSAWWKYLHVLDMNGDGRDDLVVTGAGPGAYSVKGGMVLLNDGTGAFYEAASLDASVLIPETVFPYDVDGDGRPDLVYERWTRNDQGVLTFAVNGLRPGEVAVFVSEGPAPLVGSPGPDAFYVGARPVDTVGGEGLDTLIVASTRAEAIVSGSGTTFTISVAGPPAEVSGVERIVFDDGLLARDLDGAAGQVYRLYQAAFARQPDPAGLKYWLARSDDGMGLHQIAGHFLGSGEFMAAYGSLLSNVEFVQQLYENVLGRNGDLEGSAFWVDVLDRGSMDPGSVLISFADSPENRARVDPSISDGIWIG